MKACESITELTPILTWQMTIFTWRDRDIVSPLELPYAKEEH